MCPDHSVKDGAQPVWEADRHCQKELQKNVRGIRASERPADHASTKEAQMVADSCLAVRTVMRDEGTYPLEPPGLKLYKTFQVLAASVERVMAVRPSALLRKLSRMLSVVKQVQQECERLVSLFSWIPHSAHLLNACTT